MRHLNKNKIKQASDLLSLLSNPGRLMVLCLLLEGPKSVNQLKIAIGLSQSALSQHLSKLRAAKVVKTKRISQIIEYSLQSKGAQKIIDTLYGLYCKKGSAR